MTADDSQQKTHDVDPRQGLGKVEEGREIQILFKSVVVQLYKFIGLKLKKIKELFTLVQKVKKMFFYLTYRIMFSYYYSQMDIETHFPPF